MTKFWDGDRIEEYVERKRSEGKAIMDELFAPLEAAYSPLADLADDLPLEIGDVVNLIVGGPDMVVISLCECGTAEVAWIDSEGDVNIDVFPEEALV